MRSMSVVVVDEIGDEPFELASVPDEGPVEELTTKRTDPALVDRIRDWGPHRGLEDLEAFGPEDLVKAVDELTTTVTHQRLSSGEPVSVAQEQVAGGWVVHGPLGLVVIPAKNTSRLVTSMKNSR